jgi:TolA-binding protein
MARRRITRKEIRQPDEFQSFWIKLYLDFTHDPKRFLVPAVVTLLVLALLIGGGFWLKSYRQEIRRDFASAVRDLATAADPTALESIAARFDSVASRSFLSPIGKVALYYQAAALGRAGKFTEAIELFTRYLKGIGAKAPLRFEATFATARCLEAVGRRDEASKTLEALANDPENPLSPAYLYAMGSIRENAGDGPGAVALYRQLVQKFPDAPQTAGAKGRIEELSGLTGG